jgi:hypothetical protein
MAMTMNVTNVAFQTVEWAGFGGRTAVRGVLGQILPNLAADSAKRAVSGSYRFGYGSPADQAAGSRSRWEITAETPSPRIVTPYRASAISIVRFW